MAIGTITINGYRFYNGGWSNSYRSLASSYSKSGSYCTVDRIVLPSFNSSQYSSYTINYRISLITAGGTNSGTLYGYLCSSDPASGSPSQAPHISYIGYGSIGYSGLNQGHKYFTIPITINNSLTSGGTYYLWLQTSNIAQLHYEGQVSATLDGMIAKKTLTMNAGDNGIASGTGTYTGNYGSQVNITTTAKNGYVLDRYYGTTYDGSGNNTWTGCRGKSTYTDTWALNANRNITVYTNPITYTNEIYHWAWGFKNSEGNNSSKNAFNIAVTTFTKTYGSSIHYVASNATTIPNGFHLVDVFGSNSYASDGSWVSYKIGTYFTQPAKATSVEYDYYPTTYTITYNLNGGTNNSANPSTYNVLYGVTFSKPTREGYTFLRWTINGSTVTGINPGANATFSSVDDMYNKLKSRTTGNVTVTAVWRQNEYQIQYYTNYPDSTSQTKFETTTHTAGTVATLTSSIPTKTGYIFKGWSKSSSAKLPSYYSKRPSGDISSATSLYAVWWPNFDWINYNYSEWQTFVTNCNNYLSTSLTSPNIYFKASDVNVLRTAFSLSSIAANTLITKTPLDELEAEWDKINGGY